jgi:hypothetical protein
MKTKVITTMCVAALAGAFMFASTSVSEAAKKKAAAAAPSLGCAPFWVPVCGKKGKAMTTYTNQCMAKAAGARVASQGECKRK